MKIAIAFFIALLFAVSVNCFANEVCAGFDLASVCAAGLDKVCFETKIAKCYQIKTPSNSVASVLTEVATDGKELTFYEGDSCDGRNLATYTETNYDDGSCVQLSSGDYVKVEAAPEAKDAASELPSLF